MRDWLVKLRGHRTQKEIAELVGISRTAYTNIEKGKRNPSVSTAKKIAKALGVDWVIFFEDECFNSSQEGDDQKTCSGQKGV
jgi:Predicted transcriptional regulators